MHTSFVVPAPTLKPGTRRRGVAPGYTLVEMVGVVIIIGILLKMFVPNLLGGSEAARRAALENELKAFNSMAVLHYQDFSQFPTALQAAGTPTAATMTFEGTPGVGLRIVSSTQEGYVVRVRSVDIRKRECTLTVTRTSGYRPVCTELATPWTGADPSA